MAPARTSRRHQSLISNLADLEFGIGTSLEAMVSKGTFRVSSYLNAVYMQEEEMEKQSDEAGND